MNLGTAQVIRGDARNLPLADNSVDLVVTSPPYFALRSYQDGGEHYAGQIGSEPTPAEFVAALLEVTRECVRVLKPSGSLWVNLGDKYSGAGRGNHDSDRLNNTPEMRTARLHTLDKRQHVGKGIIPAKSLMGIPWRYALACIDDLGLILRAEVIWSKPNGLPESVTDRVRRSHEQWFHFTLEPRYFSAVDEIRERQQSVGERHEGRSGWVNATGKPGGYEVTRGFTERALNPLGKLPGSVWTIPTEPLRVPDHLGIDHFAAFPTSWPRRIIQGWSPAGVCVECGQGRRPVTQVENVALHTQGNRGAGKLDQHYNNRLTETRVVSRSEATITGYVCACPEPTADTTPAVILDPFGGTGTTALVAKALGRHGITIDMSADYCRLADWRTNDRNQLAKVLGVDKQAEPDANQLDLFTQEPVA